MSAKKTSGIKNKEELFRLPILAGILLAGLLLRIVLRLNSEAYPETIYDWARLLYKDGFAAFYSHPEARWPYPPLYLYILWLMQCIIEAFHISDPSLQQLIIQLPPILCDLAGGVLVYTVASRGLASRGLIACALYVFNPAVIYNSSVWGQTDGVFTLLIALMCVALWERKLLKSFIFFGAALMIKQQSLTFAPLILIGIIRELFKQEEGLFQPWGRSFCQNRRIDSDKRTVPAANSNSFLLACARILLQGLAVITGMLLISLPFGLIDMLKQYLSVQSGMDFASVDAYNFWTLIGRNWAGTDTTVLGVSCKMYGRIAIVGITALCFFLTFRSHGDGPYCQNRRIGSDKRTVPMAGNNVNYPLLGALLISCVFCFATGMHERYLLSALLLLLLAWCMNVTSQGEAPYCQNRRIDSDKRCFSLADQNRGTDSDKRTVPVANNTFLLACYYGFSILQFLNTYLVYEFNLHAISLPKEAVTRGLSAACVLLTLLFVFFLLFPRNKTAKS